MTEALSALTLKDTMLRGARGCCPACGKGKLFTSYLKVAPACDACGEEFHHHRADDMPAYYVILIVGHVVVLGATSVEIAYHPAYWIHAALWVPLILLLSLGLLPLVKGAVVALQWHLGLHGFKISKDKRDLEAVIKA